MLMFQFTGIVSFDVEVSIMSFSKVNLNTKLRQRYKIYIINVPTLTSAQITVVNFYDVPSMIGITVC